jgi:hypothetical protein
MERPTKERFAGRVSEISDEVMRHARDLEHRGPDAIEALTGVLVARVAALTAALEFAGVLPVRLAADAPTPLVLVNPEPEPRHG